MISIVSQMMANYFYFVSVLKNEQEKVCHYTASFLLFVGKSGCSFLGPLSSADKAQNAF